MNKLQNKILDLREVRWLGRGKQNTKHDVIYSFGGGDLDHRYGVAVIISSDLVSVVDFIPLGDHIIVLKLNISLCIMNILQAYAPTNDKANDIVEDFYPCLEEAIKLAKKVKAQWCGSKIGSGSDSYIEDKLKQ